MINSLPFQLMKKELFSFQFFCFPVLNRSCKFLYLPMLIISCRRQHFDDYFQVISPCLVIRTLLGSFIFFIFWDFFVVVVGHVSKILASDWYATFSIIFNSRCTFFSDFWFFSPQIDLLVAKT